MGSNQPFVLRFWLFVTMIHFANGVKIQFYRNHNYTGLIYESDSTEKCNNFPVNDLVYSLTTDSCLITYLHSNCKSTRTWKTMPGNHSAVKGYYLATKSFHVCNDQEGGSELNIDITKHYDADKPAVIPTILESYRRICTCINIPDYIQKMDKWSINNHANEFRVYYEPNCLEDKVHSSLFPEGQYDDVRNIFNWTVTKTASLKTQFKVRSFGPNKNSTYFNASCQSFVLLSELNSKVSTLEKSLQQAELKVNRSQSQINDITIARVNETLQLKQKLDHVEKYTDDKIEKFKEEILFLLNNKND